MHMPHIENYSTSVRHHLFQATAAQLQTYKGTLHFPKNFSAQNLLTQNPATFSDILYCLQPISNYHQLFLDIL